MITAVNGIPVEHPDALGYRLTTAGLGTTVKLTVLDNGKERTTSLKLASAPETTPRDERLIEGHNPFAGVHVANLSPRVADELRMSTEVSGVVVTEIKPGSPADRLGFAPRDVVISINGTAIASTKDLEDVVSDDPGFWRVEIERDGQRIRQFFR